MPPFPRAALAALAVLAAPLLAPAALLAQAPAPLPGYAPGTAARQRAAEARAIAGPDTARARAHVRALTQESHVAGTPAQERTRDYVLQVLREAGLEVEARPYEIFLPHATAVHVWRVAPDTLALRTVEPPIPGDAGTQLAQYPMVNGYSAPGDASGEVVFANFGLIEDYAQLDSMGVRVDGKIVIARYGRSFRGIKAREAEKRGARALILYSDPLDDGFARGDVYPDGPMRPAGAVQRGSVMNGTGDPTTPGWASVPGARRLPDDSLPVPRIPVVPLAWDQAAELLGGLAGRDIPGGWQGGLPFRYHVGPGPVRARVVVEDDRATRPYKTIWNTLGTIRGTDFPDEVIVIGAHRDAWGPGAADDVSGTASVLEAARTLGALARQGVRPRRTLVFATWDAEEWGIIGSTEHAEQEAERLTRNGVAYLNQDVSAAGPSFGGGGSPSLRATLRAVAALVPDPSDSGSVYDVWRRRTATRTGREPAMGDPGGGSDFAGFYNHLGVPHADWGFGGPYGVYHSQYDTYDWMARFGDPTFGYHAAAARVGAAMLLRLANADVVPFDYAEYARTLGEHATRLDAAARERGLGDAVALVAALGRMQAEGAAFATARDSALAGGAPSREALAAVNAALRQVERRLTRPAGLVGRPWYRNVVYAADVDNGYATMVFPPVGEALRAGDAPRLRAEVADLAARVDAATAAVAEARRLLGAGR